MRLLRQHYLDDPRVSALAEAARTGAEVVVGAVHGGLFPMLVACLASELGAEWPRLVVTPDPDGLVDDLEAVGCVATVLPELDLHEEADDDLEPDHLGLARRLAACEAWQQGGLLLASPRAIEQPVPDLSALAADSLEINPGDIHDIGDLAERLVDQGYRVAPVVEEPGQLAQRGGILDIFPWAATEPYRLDFFDDEVETIRRFDPLTQETIARADSLHLAASTGSTLATEAVWKHMQPGPVLVLGDVPLRGRLKRDHGRAELRLARQLEADAVDGASVSVERFKGDLHKDLDNLCEVLLADDSIELVILARNEEAAATSRENLLDHGIEGRVAIGRLSSGWRDQEHGLLVVHDFELAHRQPARRRAARVAGGAPLSSLSDLKPGDYVVHLKHGIARFRGMATLERRGFLEDFLLLEFAEESRVYLPVSAIDLVQKYIGGAGRHPDLDRLGGKGWSKRRAKAEKAIADLSGELLEAQAQREAAVGMPHPGDDKQQRRFEAAFPYEETEDQLSCLREIKGDMESPRAMDRLLCGDVGFGKTELALRAAFKAVRGGRQVAILAPTTLLSEQHARTFTGRLEDFGVTVACMNRFRSAKEKKAILEAVTTGEVDVLIGTHALLGKGLRFAELGLLIIDEEQRFGVRHKEHLKNLRHGVDVLTLTATPIPRTLHFSMLGLREISVLAEAPASRLAVQTHVAHWDKALLRQAIERELERDGQCFIVHNRVKDIDQVAFKISRIVPQLRYEVVHGQMPEEQIASTMERFRSRHLDCIIATSIIESGIDIPNANTLFVNNAQGFGLAELHQLRGRIGRFTRQAYAYFLVPPHRELEGEAKQRMLAIQEYTELGAGFKLAMRDMELRGAGNLLGGEQSGHIEAIGYELYCRLLSDAVARRKGEQVSAPGAAALDGGSFIAFPVDAYVPDDYCEAPSLKFELHKSLDDADSDTALADIARSCRDRFGPLPDPTVRLFLTKALKRHLGRLGVKRVERKGRQLRLSLDGQINPALAEAPIPDALHVQPEEGHLVIFLKSEPDQDQALRLLAGMARLDLAYLGRNLDSVTGSG